MSLTTPTTQDISDNIIAQLETSLSQSIPLLPKSFMRVLAKALAGVFILLYKYAGFMFLQIFVRTASAVTTDVNGKTISPLTEWGRLIGVGDPVGAIQAELTITMTVLTPSGSIPAGAQLIGANNGVTYLTLSAVALVGSSVTVNVLAVSDQSGGGGAGVIGNLEPGDLMAFANPLANVARDAEVSAQVITGAEAETTEVYRQRVLDYFQKRPQGGAYSDYELWGEEVAGIINVYPYTAEACNGSVSVYVEATPASSGSPDGIPTTAQLQAVLDAITLDVSGLASRRPANAFCNAFAITRTGFAVTVLGLVVDDTVTVEADITTAVEEYFLSREPFIPGLSVLPRKDRITLSSLGGVVDDVVTAAGGVFTSVTMTVGALPVEFYTLGEGEKAKASPVSFI